MSRIRDCVLSRFSFLRSSRFSGFLSLVISDFLDLTTLLTCSWDDACAPPSVGSAETTKQQRKLRQTSTTRLDASVAIALRNSVWAQFSCAVSDITIRCGLCRWKRHAEKGSVLFLRGRVTWTHLVRSPPPIRPEQILAL